MDTEGKVWAISQRLHKVLSNWYLFWRLGEFEDNLNCPLIPCWGGSPSTKGTMDWCEEECMDLLGLPHGATVADRVAAYTSAPDSVKRACQNALKECKEYAFSRQPSSADINNAYSMIFDPDNKITTLDTPVHITTQKWRAITFTASVLIWKRDAAGGGQPTPGMVGLAGARHPACMCGSVAVRQWHSLTSLLPHFRTPALPHFCTSALPHFRTPAPPHSATSSLPHFPTPANSRYDGLSRCTPSCTHVQGHA